MKPATRDPHEAWVLENATHFTTCIFKGRGVYETKDHACLDDARRAGLVRANDSGKTVMVYAVSGVHQGHLENIEPERKKNV